MSAYHQTAHVPLARLEAAAVVVCRLDSSRLPGKVLREVRGRTLLAWVVDRTERVRTFDRGVIVATSDRVVDDPIEEFCRQHQIVVFRGSTHDVAGRVLSCAKAHRLKWFARVNADSPFVEPALLEKACQIAADDRYDLITNLEPRSFPYGVSVELVRVATYAQAYQRMTTPEHFEHVTKILYEPECGFACRHFNIVHAGPDLSRVRLTVDTPVDWEAFRQLADFSAAQRTPLSFQDVVRLPQTIKRAA
jgi:spore coat polysaccharide biosynthesis protein SpsF